ncbi:MAG: hypothetical protein R2932_34150 [Caldilineaceae bacterium]
MQMLIRVILVVVGVALLPLAWGFSTAAPWAIQWWLWEDTPLSYLFLASMQAAIAAAMIWIGLTNALHMVAAGSINLFAMLSGIAIYLLSGQETMTPKLWVYGIGCALFALLNLIFAFRARRFTSPDRRPMPMSLRIAFAIFVLMLAQVGVALVTQQKGIFPWPLSPGTSVVFGWMFLGDAFYFLYALLQPRWVNAIPQLWSFLAYDLVLIRPFLDRVGTPSPRVDDGPMPYELLQYNLLVYISVLCASALVAIYFLFLDGRTRLWFREEV